MDQAVFEIIKFLCDYFRAKWPGNEASSLSLLVLFGMLASERQESEWEAFDSVGIFVHQHETNFSTNNY